MPAKRPGTLGNTWHYLPVYEDIDAGTEQERREYSICEAYLDKDGLFQGCTMNRQLHPWGESYGELLASLQMMLECALLFEPQDFNALHPGMKLPVLGRMEKEPHEGGPQLPTQ